MDRHKILISGKANSGKDTLTNLLIQSLKIQNNYIKLAFADPMKRIIEEMYPNVDKTWLYGPSELRNNIIPNAFDLNDKALTVRKLLLDLGKFGRTYNENIWIDATINKIDKNQHLIISDARFINEFTYAKDNNFYLIRIKRPNNTYKVDDISETEMDEIHDDEFHSVITNDHDLEWLTYKVNIVTKDIIKHALSGI